MPPRNRDILVSGASIAGPVLAYWLVRRGFRPVVVERAPAPRGGGYPIDVRGPAIEVARRMGIAGRLRDARVERSVTAFVDAQGHRTAEVRSTEGLQSPDDVELSRGDLVRILHEATRDDVEYVFEDSIRTLEAHEGGVEATFERGRPRRFDLLAGADGLHSVVRALAFGGEEAFLHHLGYCVAAADVDPSLAWVDEYVQYNAPGRMAGVYGYLGRATAIFIFRHTFQRDLPFDHRDVRAQRALLVRQFPERAWRIPELLAQVLEAPDFYFDTVSQIRMPRWSRGPVVLVGDAAHAPALLSGQGTTLAMTGAYTLASALGEAGGDAHAAFARYEAEHRRPVRRGQRGAGVGAAVLIPGSALGLWARNQLARSVDLFGRLRGSLHGSQPLSQKRPNAERGQGGEDGRADRFRDVVGRYTR